MSTLNNTIANKVQDIIVRTGITVPANDLGHVLGTCYRIVRTKYGQTGWSHGFIQAILGGKLMDAVNVADSTNVKYIPIYAMATQITITLAEAEGDVLYGVIMFKCDSDLLKTLYLHTKNAFNNITFDKWLLEAKNNYMGYFNSGRCNKTFEQWINGQISAIAY